MKTPREILLKRHQAAGPDLDAIRKKTLAGLAEPPKRKWPGEAGFFSLRQLNLSLRWHLAGMSAIWLVVAFLNLNAGHSPGPLTAVPREQIPSAQIILASLRENRRELLLMILPPNPPDAGPQKLIRTQPRSQRRYESLSAGRV